MDQESKVRIQKFLAMAGVCSRRKAEGLVKLGKVYINGRKASRLGQLVGSKDDVRVEGKKVEVLESPTILFHKPRGFTCTPDERYPEKSIGNLVPELKNFPIGIGLEMTASGLILLTRDGELHQAISRRLQKINRVYHIRLKAPLIDKVQRKLIRGIVMDSKRYPFESIKLLSRDPEGRYWYEISITGQREKILTKILDQLAQTPQKVIQMSIAGLRDDLLKKKFWRKLTYKELSALKESVGIQEIK